MPDQSGLTKNLSSLQLRVLSASVLAPVAVAAVFLGGLYFTLFLSLAGMIMCFEWCRASFANNKANYCVLIAVWLLVALYLNYEGQILSAFLSLFICMVCVFILTLFKGEESEWKGACVAPVYIGVPILCLLNLRNSQPDGLALTALLFFVVWATDTGAYFSGKLIGGAKIAVSISPNKTWAGLIGGMISAAIVAVITTVTMMSLDHAVWQIAMTGALFAVMSQVGDFAESAWKRYFDIKDASEIIPGHGGVLDRLDGVLFVAPVLYLIVIVVGI
ncbi:MAG: phosphatidate cytidylyltransferase [Sneathiella sp.]